MEELLLFKATRDTKLFKKGQKIWGLFGTGALSWYVVCKYKGKGRWIRTWCHFEDESRDDGRSFFCKTDAKIIGDVKVSKRFYDFINKKSW